MLKRLSSAIRTSLAETQATGQHQRQQQYQQQQQQQLPQADERSLRPRFAYCRPDLLGLALDGEDVRSLAADSVSRPILVGGDRAPLPGFAGYAETINGGKTQVNEDQSQACQFLLRPTAPNGERADALPDILYGDFVCTAEQLSALKKASPDCMLATYFAMFDGHAGDGAATYAKQLLQIHVREKLMQVYPLLLSAHRRGDDCASVTIADVATAGDAGSGAGMAQLGSQQVSFDQLVTGALESAFIGLDEQVGRERTTYRISGGCTALVVLFLLDRVYVANAGDTRAVLCRRSGPAEPLSTDMNPYNDRERIQMAAAHHPELLRREFCPLQFARRLGRKDLGQRALCRHARMQGWFYKTVAEEDLLFPLIVGDDKKSRLLATIGVARGFGDHDLHVFESKVLVKPFLSCVPDVRVLTASSAAAASPDGDGGGEDLVVMATDGLWDVLSNEAAGDIVQGCLQQAKGAANRLTIAAQELVGAARGAWQRPQSAPAGSGGGSWRLPDGGQASVDDISCFVIPLGLHRGLGAAD